VLSAAQILMGLNHMHARKILHRDIKTLNVFLDDDLNVKLGDMGVAKVWSKIYVGQLELCPCRATCTASTLGKERSSLHEAKLGGCGVTTVAFLCV
jgi:serine/threonine protein kinase